MRRGDDGVWRARATPSWRDAALPFVVTVYAPDARQGRRRTSSPTRTRVALATNSARTVLVDLRDPALAPHGWERLRKPALRQPEDSTIYELHVRDFSDRRRDRAGRASAAPTSAFTDRDTAGMRHLRALADAGLTHVHLLPAFDFATIDEDRADQQRAGVRPARRCPPDSAAAAGVRRARSRDTRRLQLGLRPAALHRARGLLRHRPGRARRGPASSAQMVQALNQAGLRVVMDVVYNHTAAAGQDPKSVLDRIVPGYYHRLLDDGAVADLHLLRRTPRTEHAMMGKLMVDSVVTWAQRVQGRRLPLRPDGPPPEGEHARASAPRSTR